MIVPHGAKHCLNCSSVAVIGTPRRKILLGTKPPRFRCLGCYAPLRGGLGFRTKVLLLGPGRSRRGTPGVTYGFAIRSHETRLGPNGVAVSADSAAWGSLGRTPPGRWKWRFQSLAAIPSSGGLDGSMKE